MKIVKRTKPNTKETMEKMRSFWFFMRLLSIGRAAEALSLHLPSIVPDSAICPLKKSNGLGRSNQLLMNSSSGVRCAEGLDLEARRCESDRQPGCHGDRYHA
jgi:hypothetical protein